MNKERSDTYIIHTRLFIPGLGFVVMVEVAERQRHPAQELINTEEVSVEDSEDNFRCVALARDPSEPLIL